MFNEFKRPMWNDGWSTIRPWTNLYNDYELIYYCFGENGESSDSGGYGEDTGLTAAQAEAAMAAADAAAAAGLSAEAQQAAADAEAAQQAGFSDVADYTESEGISGVDPSLSELDALDDLGLLGYNDLQSYDYFDKKDAEVNAAMQAQADKRTEDLAAQGIAADINYDPVAGVYSYDAPTFGQALGIAASDVAGSLGRGFAGTVDTMSQLDPLGSLARGALGYGAGPGTISGAVASALGKDPGMSTADRMGLPEDPFQMPDVKTLDDFNREAIERATREGELEDFTVFGSPEPTSAFAQRQAEANLSSLTPEELEEVIENLGLTRDQRSLRDEPLGEMFVSEPLSKSVDRGLQSLRQDPNSFSSRLVDT